MNSPRLMRLLAVLVLPIAAGAVQAAKLSTDNVTLSPGAVSEITLSKVKGNATLANSNPDVVSATLSNGKIILTAVHAGEATLTVTDAKGKTRAKVEVVASMSVTPDVLTLRVGESGSFAISDANGKVELKNSDEDVARAKRSGDTIAVSAREPGRTFLKVQDKRSQVLVQVTVVANTTTPPPPPPPTGSLNTSGRLLASNCFQCHGTNGSGGFDRLSGSNELLQELREFASGKEDAGGIMAAHTMGYTDAQMQAIADYLANQ